MDKLFLKQIQLMKVDGTFNNLILMVYIYTLQIRFAEDNQLIENGTIHLFR